MTTSDLVPRPYAMNCDGIFAMPDPDYRKAPGVSQSELKVLMRSPAHLLAYRTQPKKKPTQAQIIGTITDFALLEPANWKDTYHLRPEGMDFRSKEGKIWKQEHSDRPDITVEVEKDIKGMVESVLADELARPIIEQGHMQTSLFCHDPRTGLLRKGRLDKLLISADGRPVIGDLKTSLNASPHKFAYDIEKWGYYIQAAYYRDMLKDLIGETPHFVFVTVEKKPPYVCTVYDLEEEDLLCGRRDWEKAMAAYALCCYENAWPAYAAKKIVTLKLSRRVRDPHSVIIPDEYEEAA